MNIRIEVIALIIGVLTFAGSLFGVYVVLKENDTRQQAEIQSLENRVTKLENNVTDELKEIKADNKTMLVKLTELETYLKMQERKGR